MKHKTNSSKTVSLLMGVLVMTFLIVFLVSAWTEPSTSPPSGNVDSPINVSSTEQTKTGGLGLGSSGTAGFLKLINNAGNWLTSFDGNSWRLKWSGAPLPAIQIGSDGNVGIGDETPDYKLDVAGTFGTDSNAMIGGDLTISGASTNFLNAIKAVDGSGSGIDADIIDGKDASNTANNIPVLDANAKVPLAQMPSGLAVISRGRYAGNNISSRGIPHGLGTTPYFVTITDSNFSISFVQHPQPYYWVEFIFYVDSSRHGGYGMPKANSTYFYVGLTDVMEYSANLTGRGYRWVAFGTL